MPTAAKRNRVVAEALNRSRKELLDLTARNRLLNTPMHSRYTSYIHVVDELSSEVFRVLFLERKPMTFAPANDRPRFDVPSDDDPEIGLLPQPEEDGMDERGIASRHADARLQTQLTSEGLQKRLLSVSYDAQSIIQEQGVNILYLALGMMKWTDADDRGAVRYAPLLFVPVSLERGNAAEKFRLQWFGEDPQHNLTLYLKLEQDFGIKLPAFPDLDDLDINSYAVRVRDAISTKSGWSVEENRIVLGFYSFSKFLMYRDLDEASWPAETPISAHPLIGSLVHDYFDSVDLAIPEDAHVDHFVKAGDTLHVVDADSSQTAAIHEVRQGRSLVIQGPPGTGKSQTITNLIAAAVHDGKRVLFLAEKLAALEVVKRRLDHIHLGPLCLELHSHKAQKRAVLEDLRRTRDLGRPKTTPESLADRLDRLRTQLNGHASRLHEALAPTGLTPYEVIGRLASFRPDPRLPQPVPLPEALVWTPSDVAERVSVLGELEQRAQSLGVPAHHMWNGVEAPSILREDLEGLQPSLEKVHEWLVYLRSLCSQVPQVLGIGSPTCLIEVDGVVRFADHLTQNPGLAPQLLTASAWAGLQVLRSALETGRSLAGAIPRIREWFTDAAWQIDPRPIRTVLQLRGGSLFRILFSDYREAKNQLSRISASSAPTLAETLSRLDQLWNAQQASLAFENSQAYAAQAFGSHWQGLSSDWDLLDRIVAWFESASAKGLPPAWVNFASLTKEPAAAQKLADDLRRSSAAIQQLTEQLSRTLQVNVRTAFGCETWSTVDLPAFEKKTALWKSGLEQVSSWIAYNHTHRRAVSLVLHPVVAALHEGALIPQVDSPGLLRAFFERSYHLSIFRAMRQYQPELAQFDGMAHQRAIDEFRRMDVDALHSRLEVLHRHYQQLPKNEGGGGALGILNGEFAKKRRHLPIRQLLRYAAPAVQAIKPVFMMSPLSVAQFLEPGAISFDLLIIDEASQVQPVDALGAIARAKQIVVVGDDKQLPPTQFFQRMVTNDDPVEVEDGPESADIESILGLCQARGLQRCMLRWHYRSKHHSLIAVSNREFYEGKLYIVPSPYHGDGDLGLRFHHLPSGTYETGASRANQVEAQAVARAVMEHARNWPSLTLGVAAFSVSQREAILDELEALRRSESDCEDFFSAESFEPFFVKNLANVQGDERDVIFISVGYGRNQHGQFSMRFGPLNNEGGERRLNVLISRARRRCEVFSSITADDIDLERARGRGVAAFAAFLRYAQSGSLEVARQSSKSYESPFEEEVATALRAAGHTVHTQIGVAGFFIDLAIQDPAFPGRYLIGIECDGASYHSARSARDRDRLRQAILEDHGWIIHRIWSTDWYQRPQQEIDRVLRAAEDARRILQLRSEVDEVYEHPAPQQTVSVEREKEDCATQTLSVSAYVEAEIAVPRDTEPHIISIGDMAELVRQIVEIESPVHEEEVIARIRMNWGLSRAGTRIQTAVRYGLNAAVRHGKIHHQKGFYVHPGKVVQVRDRSSVTSNSLKKPENLPPAEVEEAVLLTVREYLGATRSELPQSVLRIMGFRSTSNGLRSVVENAIDRLVRAQRLTEQAGILIANDRAAS